MVRPQPRRGTWFTTVPKEQKQRVEPWWIAVSSTKTMALFEYRYGTNTATGRVQRQHRSFNSFVLALEKDTFNFRSCLQLLVVHKVSGK